MIKKQFHENWVLRKKGEPEEAARPVILPHDAMIHEKRQANAAGGSAHGYFPGGIYIYEKRFTIPEEWREKSIYLEFEGVYKNSTVSLNGTKVGGRPYGYVPFLVKLNQGVKYGEENILTVEVDNSMLSNSRWYTGSGIYRPVTCGTNLMILGNAAKGKGIYQDGETHTAASDKKNEPQKEKNNSLAFNIMASLIGSGMNKAGNSKRVDAVSTPFLDTLDIAGYNYGSGRYPLEAKAHPERVIFGSETFPQDIWKNWEMVKKYPYLIGDFMWTAWDYLGEAGLGAWSYTGGMPFNRPYPWLLGGAGVIDILGVLDASCCYAAVTWDRRKNPAIGVRPANHPGVRVSKSVWRGTNAIESWSWDGCDGNKTIVEVYARGAAAEFLLNDRSLGKKKLKECKALFKTRYAPGILTAVIYDADGKETGRSRLESASGKRLLEVHAEEQTVKAGDIVYVDIMIKGENGIVESNADTTLTCSVTGGVLLGFGSADPCTEERYDTGTYSTYYGRAQAVVYAEKEGELCVNVSGKNLYGETQIKIEKE